MLNCHSECYPVTVIYDLLSVYFKVGGFFPSATLCNFPNTEDDLVIFKPSMLFQKNQVTLNLVVPNYEL